MGAYCLKANNTPCWVPQVKDAIDASIQNNLNICTTICDYYCELTVLHQAAHMANSECVKPCQASQYRVSLDREMILSKDYGLGETVLTLWFSTNTITNYKEAQVILINLTPKYEYYWRHAHAGDGPPNHCGICWGFSGSFPRILMLGHSTSCSSQNVNEYLLENESFNLILRDTLSFNFDLFI